nr:MAG TPA: hypothetical protein [Bacteriophage sp.]
MERNISITLEKAREWYNSDNKSLKELALQAFSENELKFNFRSIKSLKDACKALDLNYRDVVFTASDVEKFSKASAALFKLSVIRKALNLGQDLHLTKNSDSSYIHYPSVPFVSEDSNFFSKELKSGTMKIIGKIKSDEKIYNVLGGDVIDNGFIGLGQFYETRRVGYTGADGGFFGCATKEIAKHFSLYFGVLITEAKYGDLKDFEIIRTF